MRGEALSDGSSRPGRYNRRSRPRQDAPSSQIEPNSEAPTRVPSAASSSSSSSSTDSRPARPWRLRGSVVCKSLTLYSFAPRQFFSPDAWRYKQMPQEQANKKSFARDAEIFCPRALRFCFTNNILGTMLDAATCRIPCRTIASKYNWNELDNLPDPQCPRE